MSLLGLLRGLNEILADTSYNLTAIITTVSFLDLLGSMNFLKGKYVAKCHYGSPRFIRGK